MVQQSIPGSKTQRGLHFEDYLKSLGLQESYASQIMPYLERYYGQAQGELANTAALNRRQTLSRENQQLGGLAGQAVGSGLYGTSAYGNALRGVRSDTTRALAEGNLNASRELAGLYQNQAGVGASALGNLAGLYGGRAQDSFGAYNQNLARRDQRKDQAQAGKGQLGSVLGTLGGAAVGSIFGPIGAGIGANIGGSLFGGGGQQGGGSDLSSLFAMYGQQGQQGAPDQNFQLQNRPLSYYQTF
jgi:hypothetical protein